MGGWHPCLARSLTRTTSIGDSIFKDSSLSVFTRLPSLSAWMGRESAKLPLQIPYPICHQQERTRARHGRGAGGGIQIRQSWITCNVARQWVDPREGDVRDHAKATNAMNNIPKGADKPSSAAALCTAASAADLKCLKWHACVCTNECYVSLKWPIHGCASLSTEMHRPTCFHPHI